MWEQSLAQDYVQSIVSLWVCLFPALFTNDNARSLAGDTVTVEMHQQPGDRSCSNEAIGGDHYGPINVR